MVAKEQGTVLFFHHDYSSSDKGYAYHDDTEEFIDFQGLCETGKFSWKDHELETLQDGKSEVPKFQFDIELFYLKLSNSTILPT